jgi:hypothetical protein
MKRYSILVVEFNSDKETELCQVDANPKAVAQAALGMWLGKGKNRVSRYRAVRIRDNDDGSTV